MFIPSPIIEAIKLGSAPQAVRLAAARGILPLTNEEMLEALTALCADESEEVREAAVATTDTLKPASFAPLAADPNAPPDVLAFICQWARAPREVVEAAVFNAATPDAALVALALKSKDPAIIETLSLKQQSLIRTPEIIDAILANPARSPEAERRAREVRQEFFEKQFGVRMVADEQKAQAESAARAAQDTVGTISIDNIEDLVRLGLIEEDMDDSVEAVVASYEEEFGPFNSSEPAIDEGFDIDSILGEAQAESINIEPDRLPVFQQIALMSVKDRVMLAIKGTREARAILVRDPNRIVAAAVMRNPRLTDTEVESMAAIKTAPEEVLRQIGKNRAWTRSYTVIHNLVRNPRTPIALSLNFLNRIQTRDMRSLSLNKNIPDVIRSTAYRLYLKRSGGGK